MPITELSLDLDVSMPTPPTRPLTAGRTRHLFMLWMGAAAAVLDLVQ